jgi:hypothetical protein
MKGRLPLAGILAVGLTVAAGAPSAGAATTSPCSAKKSVTLAKSSDARVYSAPLVNKFGSEDALEVYGCRYATGKVTRLATAPATPRGLSGEEVRLARISGNFAALGITVTDGYGGGLRGTVRRVDLATGTRTDVNVCKGCKFARGGGGPASSAFQVTDLALRTGGRVAWIAKYAYTDAVSKENVLTYNVGRLDSRGDAVVDSGPDVQSKSLAANDSIVYWTRGGKPASTTFA